MMPIHGKETVISDLVYSASGANVDTTIVDGNVLMEKHQFATLDPRVIADKIDKATQDLLARSTHT
jgi:5-methylthioadenosine/S-adenosylhomocysteine deaminase